MIFDITQYCLANTMRVGEWLQSRYFSNDWDKKGTPEKVLKGYGTEPRRLFPDYGTAISADSCVAGKNLRCLSLLFLPPRWIKPRSLDKLQDFAAYFDVTFRLHDPALSVYLPLNLV